jgi:hypothetical protein
MKASIAKKTLRCAACGKRVRPQQPDLEVLEASTGRIRYFHEWCGGAAYEGARERGGAWLATQRYVEFSEN